MSRILVVDEAGLFRMLEATFFRRLGCEIVRARDSADVIAKASAGPPDLILLDTERPGLDGPGCLRILKSDPALRTIPVLVVASSSGAVECSAAGADATLTRPLETGMLERTLCSLGHVSHRRWRRRHARLPVRVSSATGARQGRLKNISRSGLFLALPSPLPLEAPVSLSLRLPAPDGDERPLRARGVVVRQVPPDPLSHLIPGVGVRFVGVDRDTESLIERFVNESADWETAAAPERPGSERV
jgi:CheY-like chemotaxis protein